MLSTLAEYLAFLGDLHPVAVHFPVALLPTVLLLKLYQFRHREAWVDKAVGALLGLALAFTLLAVALGITTREVNGFSGEAVNAHAGLGLITLGLLVFTTTLHYRGNTLAVWLGGHQPALRHTLHITAVVLTGVWHAAKWVLAVVLFPLALLYLLVRFIYRRWLKARLQPLRARALKPVKGLTNRTSALLEQLNTLPLWQNASYAAALVFVLMTGLKGADLSHGEGHLLRNMPPAMARAFGAEDAGDANRQLDRAFYEHKLLPSFRRSCIKCHGPDKQKAGLRLDSYDALIESGTIAWQDPYGSDLIRRILLPRDQDGAMPPKDRSRELRAEDISEIIAWVQGHSLETLARQGGGLAADLKTLADTLPVIEDAAIEALNLIDGIEVMRLVEDYDLLAVNLAFVPAEKLDSALTAVTPHARHIVELNLAGISLSDAHWRAVGAMQELRRLNLKSTNTDDTRLTKLQALRHLEWLNVFGTDVTISDDAFQRLIPALKTVYLPAQPLQEIGS